MPRYPNKLKKQREFSTLRQQDVADYLKIDRTAYCRMEAGERNVPVTVALRLGRLFEVSVEKLFL